MDHRNPARRRDSDLALTEVEQRLDALAAVLSAALTTGDPPLVVAALTAIRLADRAALHLKAARLAAAA